jgi:hypothetical protein
VAFHSGVGGKATVGAADINITSWELTLTGRLAETTHSGSLGVATRQKVLEEGRGSFEAPWDDVQVPDTDIALGPGDTGTMTLIAGASGKFFSFSFIIEELTTMNNAQNDVVRYRVSFFTNGAITHPVT